MSDVWTVNGRTGCRHGTPWIIVCAACTNDALKDAAAKEAFRAALEAERLGCEADRAKGWPKTFRGDGSLDLDEVLRLARYSDDSYRDDTPSMADEARALVTEVRKLLAIIADMNREAVMIYHCASGRCSKCWGSAKAAHDIALNAFEARGLPPPT